MQLITKGSIKERIKNKFIEIYGVAPYAIEKVGKQSAWTIYFVQSRFLECEIGLNSNTKDLIKW
jgi:hypothetical protein